MDNFFGFLGAYYLIPALIFGLIGFALGWILKPSKKQVGDLSVEGEGALRAEADSLRARVQDLESRVAGRDSEVSDLKTKLAAGSTAAAATDITTKTTEADDSYALEWQNRYLAARVKYLDSRLAEMGVSDDAKPTAKAASKKTAAKKAPAKKATAKKAPAKKSTAKTASTKSKAVVAAAVATAVAKKPAAKTKAAATKKAPVKSATAKAPAKKAAPAKKKPAAKSDAKLDKYYENVKKYDARASKTVVENIVKYCGISLRSRDSSLVACSDEAELQTVAKGFVTKKLGVEDGQLDLVKSVCEQMKGQRMKSRVTFYYLAAKKVKKLELFK